jgi:N-methylhydantoinase A/oxoprolinase/acetone carboxylase beta subunit
MGVAVEVMTLRAIGSAPAAGSGERVWAPRAEEAASAPSASSRRVQIARTGVPPEVPVHTTASFVAGERLVGPALVDAGDTTVWIPTGQVARLDGRGSLAMIVDSEANP